MEFHRLHKKIYINSVTTFDKFFFHLPYLKKNSASHEKYLYKVIDRKNFSLDLTLRLTFCVHQRNFIKNFSSCFRSRKNFSSINKNGQTFPSKLIFSKRALRFLMIEKKMRRAEFFGSEEETRKNFLRRKKFVLHSQ